MKKIATITPINCITKKQDGSSFTVNWDEETGSLLALFENGIEETLEYSASSLEDAANTVYALYVSSIGYIVEDFI